MAQKKKRNKAKQSPKKSGNDNPNKPNESQANVKKAASDKTISKEEKKSKPVEKESAVVSLDTDGFNYSRIWQVSIWVGLVAMLICSFWYGLSGDEPYANGMGKAAWDFIKSFGSDKRIFDLPDSINRDGVLTYYGNIFDIICIWLNWLSPFDEYTTRHLFNAFVGWVGIYFTSRTVKHFWGAKAGLIAFWLMFFFPFYFGHAMNNPKDVPMAAFYIMGVYYSIRFFENYDHLKKRDYFFLIGSIILAIDVRVSGLLLITYLPLLMLLDWSKFKARAEKANWFKTLLPIGIVAIVSYLGCSIFWPYAALNPISNPLNALSFLSNFKVAMPAIWEGAMNNSKELPSNYLFRSIYITSPWVFLIGLALGLFALVIRWAKFPNRTKLLFLVFTSLFPLFYIIYKESNVYHLWRHVIFVLPGLIILSSVGYAMITSWFKSKLPVGLIAFGLLLLEPLIFTAQTFPNSINYFNASVDGIQGAYGNYDVDYYYNSMKPCIDYFEKNVLPKYTGKDTVVLATNGYHLAGEYFKDKYPNLRLEYVRYPEKNTREWDYAIFHIALVPLDEIQAGVYGTYNNPVFINDIKDLPLCILYKRPSEADLQMTYLLGGALDGSENPGAMELDRLNRIKDAADEYLKADPNNPFVKNIKNVTEQIITSRINQ